MPAPPPDGAQAGPFPSPTVTADSVDVLNRDTNGISRHAHMVVPDRLIAGGMNAALAPGVVTVTLAAGRRATGPSPLRHQANTFRSCPCTDHTGSACITSSRPDPPNRCGHFRERAFSGASARYDSCERSQRRRTAGRIDSLERGAAREVRRSARTLAADRHSPRTYPWRGQGMPIR